MYVSWSKFVLAHMKVITLENRASVIIIHKDDIFAEVNSAKIFAASVFFLNVLEAQISSFNNFQVFS